MKNYLILFITILFVACQQKQEKPIESIEVLYYNGIFDRAMAVGCDEIIYLPEKVDTLDVLREDGSYVIKEAIILESIITDKKVLEEIAIELGKRKVTKEDYMDARMKCYILFANKQRDSLCIGSGSIYGNYNGQPVKLTNRLVYLIRKNCGFYRWIGISEFPYFDELNDTTFVREKVISCFGEEY